LFVWVESGFGDMGIKGNLGEKPGNKDPVMVAGTAEKWSVVTAVVDDCRRPPVMQHNVLRVTAVMDDCRRPSMMGQNVSKVADVDDGKQLPRN